MSKLCIFIKIIILLINTSSTFSQEKYEEINEQIKQNYLKKPYRAEPLVHEDDQSANAHHRILLCPLMMKSHVDDVAVVAVQLSSRGHQVHFLLGRSFPVPSRISRYNLLRPDNELVVEFYERPALDEELDFDKVIQTLIDYQLQERGDMSFVLNKITGMTSTECERLTMHNDALFRRLGDIRFDVVVVDIMPIVRCNVLIPHRLSVPWIAMTDLVEPAVIRVPYLPSVVPAIMLPYSNDMSFIERVKNTAVTVVQHVVRYPEPDARILEAHQKYGEFGSLQELTLKTLFWITSRDVVLDYPKTSMPNMLDAGGLTVEPATKKLDNKILDFISKAEKGLIVVSFGSGAFVLPLVMKNKMLKAFEALTDHRFLWRVRADGDEVWPSNVMQMDWLPQNDLLAHNATKLFITHCGNNGQFEALYHAVPMLGFPLIGDQPYNARRIVAKGYGLQLDVHAFTPAELVAAMREVLGDGAFKRRISKASRIYRSVSADPGGRAAEAIERVIRFGVEHLRDEVGLRMSLLQYYVLDVVAFVVAVVVAVIFIFWRFVRYLCGCFRRTDARRNKQD